ncbi:MAG: hypothetical protein NVS4B3_07430 [Gemmatimonadaceae bacterium]
MAVKLVAHGKVQGVGFRWFVREEARRLGVAGVVRNLADGSVEVIASGTADALARLKTVVAAGPLGSSVSHVEESGVTADALPFPFALQR